MDSKHDTAFLNILSEEKNITSFLDRLFGFLYRCTDFYIESNSVQRLGFPKGVAEELVFFTFRKWKNMKMLNEQSTQVEESIPCNVRTESAISLDTLSHHSFDDTTSVKNMPLNRDEESVKSSSSIQKSNASSDTYNGGSFENYKWSQSISDLDVVVIVPSSITTSKQLRIFLNSDMLEVAIVQTSPNNKKVNEWRSIVKGELSHKIKISESFWCLEPGKHVTLHLQKSEERWWTSLLDKEPRIQLSKIDCSKNFEDMNEREQMKVQELMWNQQCKYQSQKKSSVPDLSKPEYQKSSANIREREQSLRNQMVQARKAGPEPLKSRSMSKSPSRSIIKSRSTSSSSRVLSLNNEKS